MKIGIVSDSHGKTNRLRKALAALAERGAEAIVHCGDVGSRDCIAALAEADLPAHVVAGNMDRNLRRLAAEARRAGVHFEEDTIVIPLGGKGSLAVTHGNRGEALEQLLAGGRFAYVCHGHTHERRDERIGSTRVIGPGAITGRSPTAALLDSDADTVEFLRVE